jgi:septation ring formation regulator EzrA
MATPTLSDLQTQITNLTARVNLLDGQGLPQNVQGFTAQTSANIAGVKSDINGVVLSLEAVNNQQFALLQQMVTAINALLNLTGVAPPISPPTTTPPTT